MSGRAWLSTCTVFAAAAVGLLGLEALVGWTFNLEICKSLWPAAVAMNPATAVLFVLAALSLLLQHPSLLVPCQTSNDGVLITLRVMNAVITRSVMSTLHRHSKFDTVLASLRVSAARLLAAIVLAAGVLRLCEYGFGFDLGFDTWLFQDRLGNNVIAPNTALNFALLGVALLFLESAAVRFRRLAQVAALVAALVTLFALIGYAYNVHGFYGVGSFIPMAPNTTVAFALLTAGVLCAQPDHGVVALLTSRTTSGLLARLLLPTAILLPAVFGWLWLQGERAHRLPDEMGAALYAVANIVVLSLMIGLATRFLDRMDLRRRQTEDALARSERRYRQVTEASLDAIIVADGVGRVLIFNPMAERIFGYTAEEMMGQSLERLMPAEFRDRHRRGLERYTKTAESQVIGRTIELRGLRKDGSEFPLELSLNAVKLGSTIQLVGAIRDLTERHRMRAMMVQAEKLASIGLLSAGIAHEINNPLAYVANNLVVLERDLKALLELLAVYEAAHERLASADPTSAEKARTMAADIDLSYIRANAGHLLTRTREGVQRVARIVNSLRGLARTDRPEMHEASIPDLVEGTLEIIRSRLRRLNVNVEVNYNGQTQLRCVPTQISQVFLNLFVNALQAIESTQRSEGGVIRLAVSGHDTDVVIDIGDNGCGIEPQQLPHIFDPFFTTKPVGEGTGLGLAITHEIITGHGGHIHVESQPSQGTQFRIILPRRGR